MTHYEDHIYRRAIRADDLHKTLVRLRETDLLVLTDRPVGRLAYEATREVRQEIEEYIRRDPGFLHAFVPYEVAPDAPAIVKGMASAARVAKVGPMAAVAGAVAYGVGLHLLEYCQEVIIENGGDIFLCSKRDRVVGIFAGPSPFTGGIGLKVEGEGLPIGICTSAGTVGHSTSLGRADAAVVISYDVALADACATALGNLVHREEDVNYAAEYARGIPGIEGALVIKGRSLAAFGRVHLVRTGK